MEESTSLVSMAVDLIIMIIIFGIVIGMLAIVFGGIAYVETSLAQEEAELTTSRIEEYDEAVLSGAQVTSIVAEYSNHEMGFIVQLKVPTTSTIYLGRELTVDGTYYEIIGSNYLAYSGSKIDPTTVYDVKVVYNRNDMPIGMIFQGRNIEGSGP